MGKDKKQPCGEGLETGDIDVNSHFGICMYVHMHIQVHRFKNICMQVYVCKRVYACIWFQPLCTEGAKMPHSRCNEHTQYQELGFNIIPL